MTSVFVDTCCAAWSRAFCLVSTVSDTMKKSRSRTCVSITSSILSSNCFKRSVASALLVIMGVVLLSNDRIHHFSDLYKMRQRPIEAATSFTDTTRRDTRSSASTDVSLHQNDPGTESPDIM